MAKTYTFTASQILPIGVDEAFRFLRQPQNLHKIMPQNLRLRIDWPKDELLVLGSQFRTRLVKSGIPMSWDTEVIDFEHNKSFTDIQANGPFRKWEHTHLVRPVSGGTEISDILQIEMPLGMLGELAMWLFVHRDLDKMFQFRTEQMDRLFGNKSALHTPFISAN